MATKSYKITPSESNKRRKERMERMGGQQAPAADVSESANTQRSNGFTAAPKESTASATASESGALLGNVKQEAKNLASANGLSQDQQSQIMALQERWAAANAAGDQAGMDAAHSEAEKIRASAGFLGGADGAAYIPLLSGSGKAEDSDLPTQQKSAISGGYTAEDLAHWVKAFEYAASDPFNYRNGFSPDMNLRSAGNMIRQQMHANSKAWQNADAAQRAYLHEQNLQLAKVLEKATGGAKSTYNEALGRWETDNGDLGYGVNLNWLNYFDTHPGETDGLTQEMADQYANDTDRYYNYVSQDARHRWYTDESSGFTGQYENFVNGPYWQAMGGNQGHYGAYLDLVGDGFNDAAYWRNTAPRDAEGNLAPQAPVLKPNTTPDYTKSKAGYVDEHGIIQPGILDGAKTKNAHLNMWLNGGIPVENPGEDYGVTWRSKGIPAGYTGSITPASESGGGNSYEDQINAMYDAELNSQLAALEEQYNLALTELDKSMSQTGAQYSEQRRQLSGDAEREAAAQRELFNAQGINSGAIGQSQLATGGQLQSQINTMNSAQASAEAQIQMQRALLAQTYQLQIQQAEAENDYARAQALLQEAQRVDEVLRQHEQQAAQNALGFMQLMMGG